MESEHDIDIEIAWDEDKIKIRQDTCRMGRARYYMKPGDELVSNGVVARVKEDGSVDVTTKPNEYATSIFEKELEKNDESTWRSQLKPTMPFDGMLRIPQYTHAGEPTFESKWKRNDPMNANEPQSPNLKPSERGDE